MIVKLGVRTFSPKKLKQIDIEQHEIENAFYTNRVFACAMNQFAKTETTFPTFKNDFNIPAQFVKLKNILGGALLWQNIGDVKRVSKQFVVFC